jgi:Leucine-rich repeat (LRR) protein
MSDEAHRRIQEAMDSGESVLDLSNLALTELPPQVADLPLTNLQLDGNRIDELPSWLGELTGLTKLSLTNCHLDTVPDQIATLSALTELHLDDNRLAELPSWLGTLTNLRYLEVGGNRLTQLPVELTQLSALVELRLYLNRLTELPDWLGELPSLAVVNFNRHKWPSQPQCSRLPIH